jgi:hypothetical protein
VEQPPDPSPEVYVARLEILREVTEEASGRESDIALAAVFDRPSQQA